MMGMDQKCLPIRVGLRPTTCNDENPILLNEAGRDGLNQPREANPLQ